MTEVSNTTEQSTEDSFLEFAQASLKLLGELDAESTVRHGPLRVVFISDGWGYVSEDTWLYRGLVFDNFARFRSLPSFMACLHAHRVEGVFRSPEPTDRDGHEVGADNDAQEVALLRTLLDPLLYAVEHHRTVTPTTDQLRESYRAFRGEWTSPTIPWETTVPLLNIESDLAEPYRVGETLELRPFTLAEKAMIWQAAYVQVEHRLSAGAFARTEFRLTSSFTLDRGTPFHKVRDDRPVSEIGRFLTALRLLKPGRVGASAVFTHRVSRSPAFGFGTWFMGDFEVGTWGERYALKMAELPEVVALFDRIGSVGDKRLGISLRRFNQSYERERGDDQLIDLTIALESCLLTGPESKTELKNRFTLRGAALLRAAHKPQETKRLLSLIYDERSKIVHSGKSLTDPGTEDRFEKMSFDPPIHPLLFPDRAADLTRAILIEYLRRLDRGQGMDAINASLESDLLEGLAALGRQSPGEQSGTDAS